LLLGSVSSMLSAESMASLVTRARHRNDVAVLAVAFDRLIAFFLVVLRPTTLDYLWQCWPGTTSIGRQRAARPNVLATLRNPAAMISTDEVS
jgi:hypothetical protein